MPLDFVVAASLTHGAAAGAFFLCGIVIGKWPVLVVPLVYWTVVGVGEHERWWGPQPGEYLVFGTLMLALDGMIAAGAGVLTRKFLRRRGRNLRRATE